MVSLVPIRVHQSLNPRRKTSAWSTFFVGWYSYSTTTCCAQPVLHADETTLQVLKEPGCSSASKSYMWLYRTSGCAQQVVVQHRLLTQRIILEQHIVCVLFFQSILPPGVSRRAVAG